MTLEDLIIKECQRLGYDYTGIYLTKDGVSFNPLRLPADIILELLNDIVYNRDRLLLDKDILLQDANTLAKALILMRPTVTEEGSKEDLIDCHIDALIKTHNEIVSKVS